VNTILDLLDDNEGQGVQALYLNPPEGEDSDGYDDSDTEEGHPEDISRNILQVCTYQILLYLCTVQCDLILFVL